MAHFQQYSQQPQPHHPANYASYPPGNHNGVGGAAAGQYTAAGMDSSHGPTPMIGQHPHSHSAHAQSQSQSQTLSPFPPPDYLPHYYANPSAIPAQAQAQAQAQPYGPSALPYHLQRQHQHQQHQHHAVLPSPAPGHAPPPVYNPQQYNRPQSSFAQSSIHSDAAQTEYALVAPTPPIRQNQIYNYHSGNDSRTASEPYQGDQTYNYAAVSGSTSTANPSSQLTPRSRHNTILPSDLSASHPASGMQRQQQQQQRQPSWFNYSQASTHGHDSSFPSPSMQPSWRSHGSRHSSNATFQPVSTRIEPFQPSTASYSSQFLPIPPRPSPEPAAPAPGQVISPSPMQRAAAGTPAAPLPLPSRPTVPYYITCSNSHCPSLSPPNYGAPIPSPAWATLLPCGCMLCRECIHLTLTASAVVSSGGGGAENGVPNTPLDMSGGKANKRAFSCLSCGRWSAQFGPLDPTALAEADGGQGNSAASSTFVEEEAKAKTRAGSEAAVRRDDIAKFSRLEEADSHIQSLSLSLGRGSTVLSETARSRMMMNMAAWSSTAAAANQNHGDVASGSEHAPEDEASITSLLAPPSSSQPHAVRPSPKFSAEEKSSLSPLADPKKSKETKSSPELSTSNFPSILYYSTAPPSTSTDGRAQQQQRESMPPQSAQTSDDGKSIPTGSSSVSEKGYSPILSFSSAIDLALPAPPPPLSTSSNALPVFPHPPPAGALITAIPPVKQAQGSLPQVSIGGGRQRQPSKALEIKDPKSGKRILDPLGGLTAAVGRRASSPAVVERDPIYTTAVSFRESASPAVSAATTEANSEAEEKEAMQVLDVLGSSAESQGEDVPAGEHEKEEEEKISSYSEKEMEELLSSAGGGGAGSGFAALRPLPGKKASSETGEREEEDSYIITVRAMELEERHKTTSLEGEDVTPIVDEEKGGDTSADSDGSALLAELEALREEEDVTPPPPSRSTALTQNNEHERTPTSSKNAKPYAYHHQQPRQQKRPLAPWPKNRTFPSTRPPDSPSSAIFGNRDPPISPTLERVRQSSTTSLFSSSTSSSSSSPTTTMMRRGAFNTLSRRQRTATSSSAATAISGYSSSTGSGAREELRNPALPRRFLDPITVLGVRAEKSRRESWWTDPWTGGRREVAGAGEHASGGAAVVQQGVSWPILKLHNISFHTTIADLEAWVPAGILPPLSHNALSIHFLCSVSSSSSHESGMTLPYAYIECISEEAAQRLINERDEGWLAGRQVKFRAASQRALACDIFGHKLEDSSVVEDAQEKDRYAIKKIGAEDGGKPLTQVFEESANDEMNRTQAGPTITLFSEKDREDLEALFEGVSRGCSAKDGDSSYIPPSSAGPAGTEIRFVRPEERPFARLASVITKFPWHVHRASREEVDRLFSCLQVAVKTVYRMKDKMPFSRDICAMLVRAGLNCPGFDDDRKMQIKEAWSKIEDHLPNIKPESFTPFTKPSYPPPRYQQQRPFKTPNSTSTAHSITISSSMDTPNLSNSTSSTTSAYSPTTPITPSAGRHQPQQPSPPSGKFTFTAHPRVLDYSASPIPANLLTSEQRAFPNGRIPRSSIYTKYYDQKQQSSRWNGPSRHKRFTSGGSSGKPIGRPWKQGHQPQRNFQAGQGSPVMSGHGENLA